MWNDYLWPSLTVAGHPDLYPIAYRIQSVILSDYSPVGTTNYPAVSGAAMALTTDVIVHHRKPVESVEP